MAASIADWFILLIETLYVLGVRTQFHRIEWITQGLDAPGVVVAVGVDVLQQHLVAQLFFAAIGERKFDLWIN